MPKTKVNIGIIGCGHIARTYIIEMQRLWKDHLNIVSIADSDLNKAKEMAQIYGIASAVSPEALLADKSIVLVVNLTSPEAHEALNLKILESGKHLFSEKPFAQSYAAAKGIWDYAKEHNLLCAGAPDTYWAAPLQTCKKIIEDNWIGKIIAANINVLSHGVEHWHTNPNTFYSGQAGPLRDMSSYYVSALCFFMGRVESVMAMSTRSSDTRLLRNSFSTVEEIPV